MDENGIVESAEELARHLGKSARTIRRWIASGMPTLSDGRFDLVQVAAWRRKKKGISGAARAQSGHDLSGARTMAAGTPVSEEDKDYWDRESKKEQALKRRLDRQLRAGELVEREKILDMFIARILEVKNLLLSLERSLPPELIHCRTDREMAERIRGQVREALRQFARPLPPGMMPKTEAKIDPGSLVDF